MGWFGKCTVLLSYFLLKCMYIHFFSVLGIIGKVDSMFKKQVEGGEKRGGGGGGGENPDCMIFII